MAQPGGRGVGVPVHPMETPGGLQVESKYVAARHFKTIINMETISIFISFPHPCVSCSIITDLSSDNVHRVFTVILYSWFFDYGDQQEYSIRSLPVLEVQVYMSSRAQEFRSIKCLITI